MRNIVGRLRDTFRLEIVPNLWLVLALLAGLLALGCAEKPAVSEGDKTRTETPRREVIRIVFDLPGDDIGSPEARAMLDALRDAVNDSRAGDIVSSGFGMGTMEIVVALDSDQSIEAIRKIVGDLYPKAKYRIVADGLKSVQSPSLDRADKRP